MKTKLLSLALALLALTFAACDEADKETCPSADGSLSVSYIDALVADIQNGRYDGDTAAAIKEALGIVTGDTAAENYAGDTAAAMSALLCALAELPPTEGLRFEPNARADGYILVGCGTLDTDCIAVPATHEGMPVVGVAASAFEGTHMTLLYIPDSVTHIDGNAFAACTELVAVSLPAAFRGEGTALANANALVALHFRGDAAAWRRCALSTAKNRPFFVLLANGELLPARVQETPLPEPTPESSAAPEDAGVYEMRPDGSVIFHPYAPETSAPATPETGSRHDWSLGVGGDFDIDIGAVKDPVTGGYITRPLETTDTLTPETDMWLPPLLPAAGTDGVGGDAPAYSGTYDVDGDGLVNERDGYIGADGMWYPVTGSFNVTRPDVTETDAPAPLPSDAKELGDTWNSLLPLP